jgi:hypothetical protein
MRKKLASAEGERKRFRATFTRFGKKINYQGHSETTILLTGIRDLGTDMVVTDHAWFSYTKGFEEIKLEEGSTIEFDARIKEYKKGYVNKRIGVNNSKKDYKLSHPTKITLIIQS